MVGREGDRFRGADWWDIGGVSLHNDLKVGHLPADRTVSRADI